MTQPLAIPFAVLSAWIPVSYGKRRFDVGQARIAASKSHIY